MKESTIPKQQFRDALIPWSEKQLGTKFEKLTPFQRSRQMIRFFVLEVLEKLYPGIVPEDEADVESSIVDGSGDGGADFIYRSDEGHVLVIQAKYRTKDAIEIPETIGRVCDLLDRLYQATQGKQVSLRKDLVEAADQIDWEEDNFRVFFITTAKAGPGAQDRVDQGLTHIKAYPDLIEERSEFNFLDSTALNALYREALSSADFASEPINIPMIKDANQSPWNHYVGPDRELYVGEVGGGVLANILQAARASLFTMNIRDYVGDTKTNKRIIDTALDAPTNFEYFNNGVTAVAAKITPDKSDGVLICEKLSIINGAQTVRSLLMATKRKSKTQYKPLSDVHVLFRLMSFNYPSEVTFVSDVTKYNNTQNAIKIADFRSNDEVQRDLARKFTKINYMGKSFEYKNKRSQKKRNTIPITLEEFAKSVFAFRFGPDDMFGGTAKLFDNSASGLYLRLYEAPDSPLSDSEFDLLAGTYFACSYVKQLWDNQRLDLRKKDEKVHAALERRWLLYFAVAECQRINYSKQQADLNHDLSRLVKPNGWMNDPKSKPRVAFDRSFDTATKVLIQQYENRKKFDAGFKHRNWFRNPETLADIRSGLELAFAFGLPPKIWG